MLLFAGWCADARAAVVDAVEVTVGDHSIGPPFGNVVPRAVVRPVVGAAAERAWVAGRHAALLQSVRLSGWQSPNVGSGWRASTELTGRLTAGLGPFVEPSLAVGVADNWWADALRFDEVSGTYAAAADPGRLGATFGFGIGAGVDLGRRTSIPLALTLGYRWFAQTAWLPVVPIAPKAELTIGVRWTLPSRAGGEA